MVNIKVAVRIRPLSERELLHGDEIIVRKENKSVLVTNPKIPGRQDGDSRQRSRRFTVDFCYDSSDPAAGTQEAVYKEIGSEVLRSMYEGYNACVLAYGHSASGKTYTIMGLQSDPGLTPRLCEGLFHELKGERPDGRIQIHVVISFLEIYNEKVRDLLGGEETGATCGNFSLRVREHPKLGPYVQGLSQHSVADERKLLQLLAAGNRRRSTAATESNVHSSRSHAVFTIQLRQSDGDDFATERTSKVRLVDLAGSERARSSQSKARLQEGANINKSLATLGNVICALADGYDSEIPSREHSGSKTWQPFVPYRDSVLTWLLKDTLGGNSNTIMIATVSPASSCMGETVNTLRYAKRAKKIVNQPIVNEDPKIRTIRELRKEIARLKGLLIFFRSCGRVVDPWGGDSDEGTRPSRPESKWPEPEGTRNTIKEENWNKKGVLGDDRSTQEEEEAKEGGGEGKKGVWRAGGDACEISDEKKSDVNGSVNDNFSHETQFFSDSLESFSPVFLKSRNSCDADDDGSGRPGAEADEFEKSAARTLGLNFTREFGFHENPSKRAFPEMLHRSRPDLIKGISARSKDNGFPLGSSHSCTDVSNLSHSTSDNSLNSSGSAEVQPAESRPLQNPRPCSLTSQGVRVEKRERGTGKNGAKNEDLETVSKKTEKRLEIVEAVTSRLYVAKKKPDHGIEVLKKEDNEDDSGDLDELKLCKRARMKLFDLSRKLAMNRKMRKTVDSDTQTDCPTGTLRVKEKCVTTDPDGVLAFDAAAPEECPKEDKKPYVIMNQVFIPRASNYVVECGEVVRVEGPEAVARHESATQTSAAGRRCKDADTSPVEFCHPEEDCFSEDSLDSGFKNSSRRDAFSREDQEKDAKSAPDARTKYTRASNLEIHLSGDFEAVSKERSKAKGLTRGEDSAGVLYDGLPLLVFLEDGIKSRERVGFFIKDPSENALGSTKADNISSENSFASTEGTENGSLSETSSEDFVFYENPRDSQTKAKAPSDRELYTITENSEQSDPSDVFCPVQRPRPSSKEGRGDARERTENPPESREDSLQNYETTTEPGTKEMREAFPSRSVRTSNEENRRTSVEHSDRILGRFAQLFDSWAAASSLGDGRGDTDRTPTARTNARSRSGDGDGDDDDQYNAQKQYLNINITDGSRASPFSVDTHLFGKASKDQSADASADSITLVFMGPAKPKTSVLMEIIGRSLGGSSPSRGVPFGQKKSRSRGVQCGASLMRSVSVDTAMIALSRIARSPETSSEMQRTTSLGKLDPDEMLESLGKGKLRIRAGSNCRCGLETEYSKDEKEKCLLKCSVGTSTEQEELNAAASKRKTDAEKPKKSVSWFGETRGEDGTTERGAGDFQHESDGIALTMEFRDLWEAKADKEIDPKLSPTSAASDLSERRVRFLKPETGDWDEESKPAASPGDLTAFLKEATRLLRNINSRSSKTQLFPEEPEFGAESNRNKEETRKSGFKMSKTVERMTRGRTEGSERDAGWRWRAEVPAGAEAKSDGGPVSLTWPRRRSTAGKPPTGTRTRFPPRSPLRAFAPPNVTSNLRSWSQGSRTGSNGTSWNLSDLSVTLSNSYLGEADSRSPSSRSSYCNETNEQGDFCSPPVTPPSRLVDSRPNVDSILDLETDLEECCRRLEMATEQDKMRERNQERKKKVLECRRNTQGRCPEEEEAEAADERREKSERRREAMKRRKAEGCEGRCVCGEPGREPCGRLWSRGCRSSFELDSFGPGSTHCPQLCMFCRKKEAEMYYSAVGLNSTCSSDLCRLNYYGFCPCSPVKLNQVVLSPRAYMQRLLALRKRIVSEATKHSQVDREEIQLKNCHGAPWRG